MSELPKIIVAIENQHVCKREIFRGIAKFANLHGPWLFLYDKEGSRLIAEIEKTRPDAIIFDSFYAHILDKIANSTPGIAIDPDDVCENCINIKIDNSQSGRMAGRHLLSLGLKNFAFYGTQQFKFSIKRAEAFSDTVQHAGYDVHSYMSESGSEADFTGEVSNMRGWISTLPKPAGILACNDEWAVQLLSACKLAGVNVPGDIAVLGIDNDILICEKAVPPLSSIALNNQIIGYKAAAILYECIRNNRCETLNISVEPTHIISRQSTNMLAVSDQIVANALNFIRNNIQKQIQVSDVAEYVSISRRELERRFGKYLNHSIHHEIKLAKVQLITKMLLESSDTISEIAAKLGFSSISHIGRYFKDVEGISPNEYRKKNLCVA